MACAYLLLYHGVMNDEDTMQDQEHADRLAADMSSTPIGISKEKVSEEMAILDCTIGDDNIIYLTIGGNVTDDYMDTYLHWDESVRKAMVTVSSIQKDRVLTLIDVTRLQQFDSKITDNLFDLMKFNKDYATKTAVYGPNFFVRTALDGLIVMTRRKNMHVFGKRDEALAWLLDDTQH